MWRPIRTQEHCSLAASLCCGQAFRWRRVAPLARRPGNITARKEADTAVPAAASAAPTSQDTQYIVLDHWVGVVGDALVELRSLKLRSHDNVGSANGIRPDDQQAELELRLVSSVTGRDMSSVEQDVIDYLRLNEDMGTLTERWVEGDIMRMAPQVARFRGLRLLRQDPHEALFSFICSQNNHIKRITSLVETLCQLAGTHICCHRGRDWHAFPTVDQLALLDEALLREHGFGYRARFIVATASALRAKPAGFLLTLRNQPYKDVHPQLAQFIGVGRKVADCVCVFSLDHFEAVPVDTHVYQIAQAYLPKFKSKSLTPKIYDEIQQFFVTKFGSHAGWAQQIMFATEVDASNEARMPTIGYEDDDFEDVHPAFDSNGVEVTALPSGRGNAIRNLRKRKAMKVGVAVAPVPSKTRR